MVAVRRYPTQLCLPPSPLSRCDCSKEIIASLTGHASKTLAPKWAYALVRRGKTKFEKAAPYLSPSPPVAAGASAHVGKSHPPAGHSSPLPWTSPGDAPTRAAQADSCYASAAKPATGSSTALHNFVGSASASVDIRQVLPPQSRQQPRAVQSSVLCGELSPPNGAERHARRCHCSLCITKECLARAPLYSQSSFSIPPTTDSEDDDEFENANTGGHPSNLPYLKSKDPTFGAHLNHYFRGVRCATGFVTSVQLGPNFNTLKPTRFVFAASALFLGRELLLHR